MARATSSSGTPRARPRLTRATIAEAALAMIDEDGIEALSMRRLGARLGVEAMALYRHVDGRRGVLDAVADLLIDQLGEGPSPGGDWREVLSRFAHRYRRVVRAHPKAAPLLSTRPERSYVASRDAAEAVLEHLVASGFSRDDAIRAVRLVSRAVKALSIDERAAGGGGEDAEPPADSADGLPDEGYPLVRALLADLGRAGDEDDELFAFGLAVVLDGLAARRAGPAG
jgi:AcrR family transcriptional regulator